MTHSTINIATTPEDHHIAKLAALAIGLSLIDAAIPSPLPGVKPGLANIVTLLVLLRYGFNAAAWVSLLRVIAGSLLLGTFLTPTFAMSLCGAAASLLTLRFASLLPQRWFGPVSLSIFAAFAHMTGQITLAWLWLIPHAGIAYFIPVLSTAALLFGTVNGLAAAKLLAGDAETGDVSSPLASLP